MTLTKVLKEKKNNKNSGRRIMQDPAARVKQRFLPTDPDEMRRTQTQESRLIPVLQAVILLPSQ